MGTENFKIIEVTDFKKNVFLNISQNSQEHFCAAVFFNKVASGNSRNA